MKVGLIVGSLRKESWNRKVPEAVKDMFPADIEVSFIEIKELPFYNEDLDGATPLPAYEEFRSKVKEQDGFIFFTPEYNRSYAPALKNALDVASRGAQGNCWARNLGAVFSASTGRYGDMAANHALRQVFIFLDMLPMQQPEVYLSKVDTCFADGRLDERTSGFMQKAANTFVAQLRERS